MFMGLATVPEEMVVVDVDLNLEPACEGTQHDATALFHGGPATHFMRSPCHHSDGLRCAPIVVRLSTAGGHCGYCFEHHRPEEYVFIPL